MLNFLPAVRFADILDILVVDFIIYWSLLFVRGTRAVQMLYGLLILMGMFVLSRKLGMVTFQWLVGNFLGGLIIILGVIYQSEIRRGLAKMGQAPIFGGLRWRRSLTSWTNWPSAPCGLRTQESGRSC